MVKKLFALASITALTGLTAAVAASGCSSTTTVNDTPEASAEASVRDTFVPPVDAPDPPQTCPGPKVVTEADIGLTWVSPGPIQDVCTQQNLDDLKKVFADGKGSAKYSDIEKSLGATCAACVFTPVKGTRWGVILKDGANVVADNSQGSCFGQLSSAKEACGKAVFEYDSCLDIACPQTECGATADDQRKCNSKALKGPCKTFQANLKACPDLDTVQESCKNFIQIIQVNCAGGPDSGRDAAL